MHVSQGVTLSEPIVPLCKVQVHNQIIKTVRACMIYVIS